jgi:hypothetical protein
MAGGRVRKQERAAGEEADGRSGRQEQTAGADGRSRRQERTAGADGRSGRQKQAAEAGGRSRRQERTADFPFLIFHWSFFIVIPLSS